MRKILLEAVRSHAQGHVDKHLANIEIYLANPTGIGEHSDVIEAIEVELEQVAKYQDQLDILNQYYPK